MMTKQDFVKAADAFAKHRPLVNSERRGQWEALRETFCDLFHESNPNFNRQRFIEATEK